MAGDCRCGVDSHQKRVHVLLHAWGIFAESSDPHGGYLNSALQPPVLEPWRGAFDEFGDTSGKHPPGSLACLRRRDVVDSRLRERASRICGTDTTPLYLLDDFLSSEECCSIIESVRGNFVPSAVTRHAPGDPLFRSSETCHFEDAKCCNGVQARVERKIDALLQLPFACSEGPAQVQHYAVGKQFKAHTDFYDRESDASFWMRGQRTWTVMVYLNDVAVGCGGTTSFEYLDEDLLPVRGRAVVWCNLTANGEPDAMTLHRSAPVKAGDKYM